MAGAVRIRYDLGLNFTAPDHPLLLTPPPPSSRVAGLSYQSRPTFGECCGFKPSRTVASAVWCSANEQTQYVWVLCRCIQSSHDCLGFYAEIQINFYSKMRCAPVFALLLWEIYKNVAIIEQLLIFVLSLYKGIISDGGLEIRTVVHPHSLTNLVSSLIFY